MNIYKTSICSFFVWWEGEEAPLVVKVNMYVTDTYPHTVSVCCIDEIRGVTGRPETWDTAQTKDNVQNCQSPRSQRYGCFQKSYLSQCSLTHTHRVGRVWCQRDWRTELTSCGTWMEGGGVLADSSDEPHGINTLLPPIRRKTKTITSVIKGHPVSFFQNGSLTDDLNQVDNQQKTNL